MTPLVRINEMDPPVWGDIVQLEQLLLNLILNAIDAIKLAGKEEGSISIMGYSEKENASDNYHLYVSDTGGGFKDGAKEKVFEPFFSTKQQGLGLGLSISQAIAESHGGIIRAEDNNEGGATFHTVLPIHRENAG